VLVKPASDAWDGVGPPESLRALLALVVLWVGLQQNVLLVERLLLQALLVLLVPCCLMRCMC
jgi:hypothetical protein